MSTKEGLLAQVKEEWDGFAITDLMDDAGKDKRRSALLHEYHHKGLTTRELAKAIKKTHPFVTYHLRYHRFLVTTVTDITERCFREYWHQCSDPLIMKGGRGEKIAAAILEHELVVFPVIAAKVQAGELPVKVAKVVKPKTPEQLSQASDVLRALEKEYKEVYGPEFERITKELRALLTANPRLYRPAHIAEYVRFFDEAVSKYHKLMTGLSKQVGTQKQRRSARRPTTPQQPTLMTERVN